MGALVQFIMRIFCYILTFLSMLFPGIWGEHSCPVCETCEHTGGVASCTQQAVCELCGKGYGDFAEHIYFEGEKTSPTCEKEGLQVFICETCGHSYSEKTENALEHDWSEWEKLEDSTCIKEGKAKRTCRRENCNATETKAIDKLEHSYTGDFKWNNSSPVKTHSQKCVNGCNEYGDETKCTFEEVVTAPTCIDGGKTNYKCTVCSNSFDADFVSALGHDREYAPGNGTSHEVSCTRCDYSSTENCSGGTAYCNALALCEKCNIAWGSFDENSHSLVHVKAQAPTCTEDGWDAYEECSGCDYSTYVKKDALGHTEVTDAAVAPDCENTGLTEGKHCSVCEKVLVAQTTVAAKGHTWTDATCTAPKTCSVCSVTEGEALGHNYNSVVTAPTCTTDGYTTYTCTKCSHGYSEKGEASLGHSFTTYVDNKNETCLADATETATCDRCTETDVRDVENSMLRHKQVDANSDKKCDNCGNVLAFRFDPLEYPEEAIAEKSTASELRTYLSRADKNDDLYASTQGYEDNGVIASPYFDVKIEGEEIPVYGTVVYVPESQTTGHGGLHSFSEIYIDTEATVKTFDISLTSIWNELNITSAEILSTPGYTNSTLVVNNGTVTATITGLGVYTFVFNGHDADYVYTLAVRPYYDDDATIAYMQDQGYTVYVLEGYVDNVYDYVCFSGGAKTDDAPKGIQVDGDKQVIYLKQGAYVTMKHRFDINSDADNSGNAESGALANNGIGLNRYPFISSNGKNAICVYGFGAFDMTHLDRGERRGFVFAYASDIQVIGTKLINPCEWAVVTYRCNNVLLSNVDVYGYRQNSDAFDICNSQNVTVQDCMARSGDDIFCIKTLGGDENAITDNVTVKNCYAWASKARAFGIFGEVNRPITNVNFTDCTVLCHDATWDKLTIPAIGIVAVTSDNNAGAISAVKFDNIEICRNDASPINCITSLPIVITDITFNNVKFATNNLESGYPIVFDRYNGNNDMYNITFTEVYCGDTLITRDNSLTYFQDENSRWHAFDNNTAGN